MWEKWIKKFNRKWKSVYRNIKCRVRRIYSPDFWVCDWCYSHNGPHTGKVAVFGNTLDEASKDADIFLHKYIKTPPGVDEFIIEANISKPTISQRIHTTSQHLILRKIG